MIDQRSVVLGSLLLSLLAPAAAQDGQTIAVEVSLPTLEAWADPEKTQPIGAVTQGQVYVQIDSAGGMAKVLWSQAGPTYAWLEEGELVALDARAKYLVVEPTGCGPLGTTPGWLVAPMGKTNEMKVGPETDGLMVVAHAGDTYLLSTKHLLRATDNRAPEKKPRRKEERKPAAAEPEQRVPDEQEPQEVGEAQAKEDAAGFDGGEGKTATSQEPEEPAPEEPASVEPAAQEPAPEEPAPEASAPGEPAAAEPASDEQQPDLPNSRRGFVQLPAGGRVEGYYCYGPAARRWGTEELVYGLMRSARSWVAAPRRPRLGIGDLSLENGGPIYSISNGQRRLAHQTHQTGRDADVRPLRNDGLEGPVTIQSPAYSRSLTQAAVDLFRSASLGADDVLFNDGAVRGRRPVRGHDNHLHVSVR